MSSHTFASDVASANHGQSVTALLPACRTVRPWPDSLLIGVAALFMALCFAGCGSSSSPAPALAPPPPAPTVTIAGPSGILATGADRTFTAAVTNSTNQSVTWSVVESGGGSVTSAGVYTAPALPGTFTIKAASVADPAASTTASVPVVIPVGHIAGYDVGVDYHAITSDFVSSAFITQYNVLAVRQTVLTQLQGMVDRGATVFSTRVWFVNEPGEVVGPQDAWRATFPMTDQEEANLRLYAQDVAKLIGSGGNRPRLDICMLWLGAADYTRGDLTSGLGWTPLTPTVFTTRVEQTTDKLLDAVTNVLRPDGVPVVDTIYMEGEVTIGAKANQDWFLTTHYPRFVSRVSAAGFNPAVYFITATFLNDQPLAPGYVDANFPILNGHRTMFWIYRSLNFMVNNGLPIPKRIDFSCYTDPAAGPMPDILTRALDDADATLPSLGAPKSYGAAETYYFLDDGMRKTLGQAFASEAAKSPRMQRVTFWTSPDGGGAGVNAAYPFAIEDFYPPLTP
jgi:hypothetical protein